MKTWKNRCCVIRAFQIKNIHLVQNAITVKRRSKRFGFIQWLLENDEFYLTLEEAEEALKS